MRQAQEEELKEKHGFVSNTSFGIMHYNTIMAYNNKNNNGRLCEKYLGGKGDLNLTVGREPIFNQGVHSRK